MPSWDHSSSLLVLDVLRLDPDDHQGGLGDLRLEVLVVLLQALGHGEGERADGDVLGTQRLVRVHVDRAACPWPTAVWRSLFSGQRAEVAQQHDAGERHQGQRAEHRVADQLAAAEARTPWHPAAKSARTFALTSGAASIGVPLVGDLLVGHQGAGPVDRARADAEERHAEGQAEREVQRADVPDRQDVDDLVDREDHVRGDEADRGQHRQREQEGDRALGALGGPLVDVLDAVLVRRQARVGERVRPRPPPRRAWPSPAQRAGSLLESSWLLMTSWPLRSGRRPRWRQRSARPDRRSSRTDPR